MSHALTTAALRGGIAVVDLDQGTGAARPEVSQAAAVELARLGFLVDPRMLAGATADSLAELLAAAGEIAGADRAMTPIYPGFPAQVRASNTLTLLIEQILHYITAGEFLPVRPDQPRPPVDLEDLLVASRSVIVVDADQAPATLASALLGKKVSLGPDEVAALRAAAGEFAARGFGLRDLQALSHGAPNDENLGTWVRALVEHRVASPAEAVVHFAAGARHPRELLRIVLSTAATVRPEHAAAGERAIGALHGGSAYAITLVSLPRAARRAVVSALGRVTGGYAADRLLHDANLWRRIMRGIHPYSQIQHTEATRRAVDIICGNIEHRTLASVIEEAYAADDSATVIETLAAERPGELLRQLVRILRTGPNRDELGRLIELIEEQAPRIELITAISSYNGVIAANFGGARLSRVAGRANHVVADRELAEVAQADLDAAAQALAGIVSARLAELPGPKAEPVGLGGRDAEMAVPLVRRDLSETDRRLERGSRLAPVGQGKVLRLFSHWRNTHTESGYLDLGAVVLDESFAKVATATWDSWTDNREWATYSGDCLVHPGKSAAEYIDVDTDALKDAHPEARYVVMTIQSWSGIPLNLVDAFAGAMLRSGSGESGETFEPRSVASASHPSTTALQSMPLLVDLSDGSMIWLDTSSGSDRSGVSANQDQQVGPVVRDELARPRMALSHLMRLWADAHGARTDEAAPIDADAALALLD